MELLKLLKFPLNKAAPFSSSAFKGNIQNKTQSSHHAALKLDEIRAIYQKQPKTQMNLFRNFEEIPHLSLNLLEQMNRHGIANPTEIQMSMFGHFFQGSPDDILIKSQPGSGKSLGYVIMLLADFFKKARIGGASFSSRADGIKCKYLIIVPSDLLARQIDSWFRELSQNSAKTALLCETFEQLQNGPDCDFLIATPESFRIKLAQGSINVKGIECVVLDEADALVKPLKRFASPKQKEMRIKHPVTTMLLLSEILKAIASNKLLNRPRMIVASATLNKSTRDQLISTGIVKNPIFLEDRTPLQTRQDILNPSEAKVKHFHALLKNPEDPNELLKIISSIVKQNNLFAGRGALFLPAAQSKLGLCELLRSSPEFKDISIGLLNQYQQQREGKSCENSQLLIASDIDCRGIDIPELAFVIILDLPGSVDNFIHMAGRVGRTSQLSGNVYTILGTIEDFNKFSSLLRHIPLTSIPFMDSINE